LTYSSLRKTSILRFKSRSPGFALHLCLTLPNTSVSGTFKQICAYSSGGCTGFSPVSLLSFKKALLKTIHFCSLYCRLSRLSLAFSMSKSIYVGCFRKLCSFLTSSEERLISAPGCSLSAGRAVSLLGAQRLWGLTCPAAPAGVSHLTLQSTNFFINGFHSHNLFKNNNLLEKSLK
jgi:hypothetical protein